MGESTIDKILPDLICIWIEMRIGPCQTEEAIYGLLRLTMAIKMCLGVEFLVSMHAADALWSHFEAGPRKSNLLQQPGFNQGYKKW